jgi:hypothetical protein
MKSKKPLRLAGIILFLAGSLLGVVLFTLMNWAYLEADFYFGFAGKPDKKLTSLRCPLLMTSGETGRVSARLTNTTNKDLAPIIRTEFSENNFIAIDEKPYQLAAGETRRLSWNVNSDNLAFGHLVLARVHVANTYTLPSYGNACGTVMLDVPGVTGSQLFIIWLAFVLAAMTLGWILWLAGNRPILSEAISVTRAMVLFTVATLLGLAFGIIGEWLGGLFCLVACVLLFISVLGQYIQKG